MEQSSAAAGWYPDPEMADTIRYWDGTKWTEHRAPQQKAVKIAEKDWREMPSLTGGFWLAALFPIGGVIYGIAHIREGGERVIAASIGFALFWFVFFTLTYGG